MKNLVISVVCAAFMSSCGAESPSIIKVDALPTLSGVDASGRPCSLSYARNQQGLVTELTFQGTYLADYKIPAPLSGIYGVHPWGGEFNLEKNSVSGSNGVEVKKAWLGNVEYIETSGKAIFWDTSVHNHKISFEGGITSPKVVRYHAAEKIGGIVTFVTIDLECKF